MHDGVEVTHPRLQRAFLRGVRFAAEEGVFVVQLGRFRGQIEVEDTAFWVVGYDAEAGAMELTDESHEPLQPQTLSLDPDGVLRCRVKGRFPARFTRRGQLELFEQLEFQGSDCRLRVAETWVSLPQLMEELETA